MKNPFKKGSKVVGDSLHSTSPEEEGTCLKKHRELHRIDWNIHSLYELKELSAWTHLRSLILHSNHIKLIENFTSLVHLKLLDLSSNDIVIIENLDSLVSLEVLNLASNKVQMPCFLIKMKRLYQFKAFPDCFT